MKLLVVAVVLFLGLSSVAQENPDYLMWSPTKKLDLNDFGIKKSNSTAGSSFAQFSLDFSLAGFDYFSKNFNKKVKNSVIKSASWIDTTANVEASIKYQQTLFDIAEIYARIFRKELKENRKQLVKGLHFVESVNSRVSSEFTKRRLKYDEETKSGTDFAKQQLWEDQIRKELDELSDFQYEK
jgi:hypothetical protein